MADRIRCAWYESLDQALESLRRYVDDAARPCPLPHGYHDATLIIGTAPWHDPHTTGLSDDAFNHADPGWPLTCDCGYAFTPDDVWQHQLNQLYRDAATGHTGTIPELPPGAIWDATWYPHPHRGPDARCLVIRLPGHYDWLIDGPASNGPGWTRTGTPPDLTARPSIMVPGYHGFLTDGYLVRC